MFERIDVSELVSARFSFVTEDRAVKLVGVLAQPFLAGNRAAFGCRDDFLADSVNFSIEIGDVLAKRIALGQTRSSLGQCLSQRENPIHQRAFVTEQCMNFHRGIKLRLAVCGAKFRTTIETDC